MLGGFNHFEQRSLLDISGYVNWPSHVLQFTEDQFAELALEEDYWKTMSKNSVFCHLDIKACFDQQENPSKAILMIM